jgi:hypothetical protein
MSVFTAPSAFQVPDRWRIVKFGVRVADQSSDRACGRDSRSGANKKSTMFGPASRTNRGDDVSRLRSRKSSR